jgi:putative phosphoesterase
VRVAALYDVHGNLPALTAVLAEVDTLGVDAIVVGGDVASGPMPAETLDALRARGARFVRGNAERVPDEWDAAHLYPDELRWLEELPVTVSLDGVLYCHATPIEDTPLTTVFTPDEVLLERFAGFEESTVVIGHTHHQFDRPVGGVRVVNAGSVGMPYEDRVEAFWTLVTDGEPSFRSTPFDVERAAAEIRVSGWPGAGAFVAENLLVAPSRAEAIAFFESQR